MRDEATPKTTALAKLQHGLETDVALDELDVLVEEAKAEICQLYPDMQVN